MVNEFCGFKHGVIGTDKMPADTTLNNMKKADLIKLLHTAQHNYETLMWFYNNAVKVNMSQLNNNGWISCSERLPQENEPVDTLCEMVNVMLKNGIVTSGWCNRYLEKWYVLDHHHDYPLPYEYKDVIAWQPLPQAYQALDMAISKLDTSTTAEWKQHLMNRFERV